MTSRVYLKLEVLRTFRNRRFFIFSLGFPVILYLVVAGANKHAKIDSIPFVLYYMTGMVSFGGMAAVLSAGARISLEREVGWNRQLRLTPLSARAYMGSKVLTGYVMAVVSIAILFSLGLAYGVHLGAGRWVVMAVLILVGLIPFSVLGIMMGLRLSPDSMGPAMGGVVTLFALLGGAWGPLVSSGFLQDLVKLIPSYWLVEAGKSSLTGKAWPAEAWIVIAVWTLVTARLTMGAYRRDTGKV